MESLLDWESSLALVGGDHYKQSLICIQKKLTHYRNGLDDQAAQECLW